MHLLPAIRFMQHIAFSRMLSGMVFTNLNNLYWFMRYNKRNSARKRKYYRLIANEKKRLLLSGVDPEELRLFCRHLANPRNEFAIRNLTNYQKKMQANRSFSSASAFY